MGPFEEAEEGTGLASDVVKVEGEDLATPGPLKRNDPGTITISRYRVNKTKQHTHNTPQHTEAHCTSPKLSLCVYARACVCVCVCVWVSVCVSVCMCV